MGKFLFSVGTLILLSATIGIAGVFPVVSGGHSIPVCTYTAIGDVAACE